MALNFIVLVGISVACIKYKEADFSLVDDVEAAENH
jgi:hypothetical protein